MPAGSGSRAVMALAVRPEARARRLVERFGRREDGPQAEQPAVAVRPAVAEQPVVVEQPRDEERRCRASGGPAWGTVGPVEVVGSTRADRPHTQAARLPAVRPVDSRAASPDVRRVRELPVPAVLSLLEVQRPAESAQGLAESANQRVLSAGGWVAE